MSMQRRASLRAQAQGSIHSIDEVEDEEDRANRAAKELVERIQKQNEEYKKSNLVLKSQLELLTDQLIEVSLQRAELLTNIDREILEKRKLRDRLQWYEWSSDIWGYLDLSPLWRSTEDAPSSPTPPPDSEELKDTE
jgi:predicted nuclease with TOPRIM domain